MSLQIGSPPKRFQSTWDTTEAGSSNNQVVLPLQSNGDYDFRIDWGDGTSNRDTITAYDQAEVTHTYDSTGVYEIRIIGGITGWRFNSVGDDDKITEISKWGPLTFNTQQTAFYGCSNLVLNATDSPTFTQNTNMQRFLSSCALLGDSGNMNSWDLSSITAITQLFENCTSFNQPVGNWDVSNVTDMRIVFQSTAFNQDLSNWDTSSVNNMGSMFAFSDFNQPINDWDVSKVTSMSSMFRGCPFNQPLSGWDVSSVTTMHNMFNYNAPFDQDIGSWNVTGVVGTPGANDGFRGTFSTRFNNGGSPSISGWDVSNCRNMVAMFQGNSYFNQPIGYWDTSSLESMYNMFDNADAFDQDLSNWNVSNVTSATNFMVNANGLSTTNYDRTLSGWSSQSVQNGVNIHFGSSNYSTATGAAYRATLVSKGWTITDGGAV